MNIRICTEVEQDYLSVFKKFDLTLLKRLKPPFIGLTVLRFDGCNKGDVINTEINIFGLKQQWNAMITEIFQNENENYFTDEGTKLPFFLKSWKHVHRIISKNKGSIIIDSINFKSPNIFFDSLLYPVIYFQFYFRKHIYKSYFKK